MPLIRGILKGILNEDLVRESRLSRLSRLNELIKFLHMALVDSTMLIAFIRTSQFEILKP